MQCFTYQYQRKCKLKEMFWGQSFQFTTVLWVVQGCSVKLVLLEISQNSQENTCARVSFLIKLQALGLRQATLLKKQTLAQEFSCEFCRIFENTFFYRTPLAVSSDTVHLHCTKKSSFLLMISLVNVRKTGKLRKGNLRFGHIY